jgi:uncharacterized protein YjbI with pentapeptide repeats
MRAPRSTAHLIVPTGQPAQTTVRRKSVPDLAAAEGLSEDRLMSTLAIALVALAIFAAFTTVAYLLKWQWTGFAAPRGTDKREPTTDDQPRQSRKLWDWLQLLVVPLVLAGAAYALNEAQSDREHRQQEARAKDDRAIAVDTQREAALRTYLQQMSDLMLNHDLYELDTRKLGVASLARTLTLTVFRRLDLQRKGLVLRFLDESGLLVAMGPNLPSAVDLRGADLRDITVTGDFVHPWFVGVDFSGARFSGELDTPNFRGARLRNADFRRTTILGSGDFKGIDARGADFSDANLNNPDFRGACLTGARFVRANWSVRGTTSRLDGAFGRNVDLSGYWEKLIPPWRATWRSWFRQGLYLVDPKFGRRGPPAGWPKPPSDWRVREKDTCPPRKGIEIPLIP